MPYSHTNSAGIPVFTSADRQNADGLKANRSKNFNTSIRYAPTGQREILRGNWMKFKEVAAPKYGPGEKEDADNRAWEAKFGGTRYSRSAYPVTHARPEEIKISQRQTTVLRELGRLTKEKERLEAIMEQRNRSPSIMTLLERMDISRPSLAQRIETTPPPPATPIPTAYKNKHIERYNDVQPLFIGTNRTLQKLRSMLKKKGHPLPKVFRYFEILKNTMSLDRIKRLENKQWRNLKSDCRVIGILGGLQDIRSIETELIALSIKGAFNYK